MAVIRRWLNRRNRWARVDITCPHGQFIPTTLALSSTGTRLGCEHCDTHIRISFYAGERYPLGRIARGEPAPAQTTADSRGEGQ